MHPQEGTEMSRLTRMINATLGKLEFVKKQAAPSFAEQVERARLVHDLERTAKKLKRVRRAARADRDARETYPADAGIVADLPGHRRARDTDRGQLLLRASAAVLRSRRSRGITPPIFEHRADSS